MGTKRLGVFLLLYVDDMLIASKDKKEIQKLKRQLGSEFEIKDVGQAKKILGMEIIRDREQERCLLHNVVISGSWWLSLVCRNLKRFKHR